MQNASIRRLTPLLFLMVIATSSSAPPTTSEQLPSSNTESSSLTEAQEIREQIKRIEQKLETEPKAEGWVLIGDAHMHLQAYREAVEAYQNAYLLSDDNEQVRSKLKRALYQAGMDSSSD